MTLKDWFANRQPRHAVRGATYKRDIPDGLWIKCEHCDAALFAKELSGNLMVCPRCDFHFRVGAIERISQLADAGSFKALDESLRSSDPLGFVDTKPYRDRLKDAYSRQGTGEAVITGTASMGGIPIALGVMNFFFMGGSMGAVVGEKITRLIETAHEQNLPLIVVTASGGARMQEGAFSLMQMAKTTGAISRYQTGNQLYVSILADPTTGGVTASFPSLADVILSEPGALIGFAGRRVIEQTIRQKLPADFQKAESLLENGLIDMIVHRTRLKAELTRLLTLHGAKPA